MANDDLHCGICHGETDGIFRIGTWTSASIKVGKSALIKQTQESSRAWAAETCTGTKGGENAK
jgi:hypothetical protein